jgi:2-polyprenyl-3-methyl-5-hydroxy-6-metoxy-1,4-benzoquinol methylase
MMPVSTLGERSSAAPAQRVVCSYCGNKVDPSRVECAVVPSNVRTFMHESFHIWRCPTCRSLHCLETVDLATYYQNYPIQRTLTNPARVIFGNLLSRLTKHGYAPASRLLDYGCGWGVFVDYLRERGYVNAVGYDPYSAFERFRDHALIESGPFDYILLQDVIEHVEDPRALLPELDRYLKPGGYVLIGTPDADGISLRDYERYWMQLHPPYHLHIYNRTALEAFASEVGWRTVDFFDRPYYDTKQFGVNARALNIYRRFGDGTLDAVFDHVPADTLKKSKRFMLTARFGYWFKRKGEMALVFRKGR